MADILFDSQYKEFDKARDALGHQTAGLVGFLIKISGGRIKSETANNILIVITVVSFTLSAVIFSRVFFSEENNAQSDPPPISKETILPFIKQEFPGITDNMIDRLPEIFYREDIPPDIASKLPQEIIDSIPTRP